MPTLESLARGREVSRHSVVTGRQSVDTTRQSDRYYPTSVAVKSPENGQSSNELDLYEHHQWALARHGGVAIPLEEQVASVAAQLTTLTEVTVKANVLMRYMEPVADLLGDCRLAIPAFMEDHGEEMLAAKQPVGYFCTYYLNFVEEEVRWAKLKVAERQAELESLERDKFEVAEAERMRDIRKAEKAEERRLAFERELQLDAQRVERAQEFVDQCIRQGVIAPITVRDSVTGDIFGGYEWGAQGPRPVSALYDDRPLTYADLVRRLVRHDKTKLYFEEAYEPAIVRACLHPEPGTATRVDRVEMLERALESGTLQPNRNDDGRFWWPGKHLRFGSATWDSWLDRLRDAAFYFEVGDLVNKTTARLGSNCAPLAPEFGQTQTAQK